jgi:hypothetical protein
VRETAGPGNALAYHAAYEFGGDVTTLPAGQAWLDVVNQAPEEERHLAIFDQHLVALSNADQVAWAAGSWAAIPTTTVTGSAAQLTERLAEYAEQGITEILYQPAGSDIAGELETFLAAARSVQTGLLGGQTADGTRSSPGPAGGLPAQGACNAPHGVNRPGKAGQTTGSRAQLRRGSVQAWAAYQCHDRLEVRDRNPAAPGMPITR